MSFTTETDSLSLQWYVVGYFDLLGQQEHLRNLRSLPNRNDLEALARTRDDLKNTYGAVVAMRNMFKDAFDAFKPRTVDTSSLTPEQLQVFQQMGNKPIQFYGFSDSMVAFQPLRITEAAKLPVRGIFGIIVAAATTFVGCLGVGHPIRGGIDLGVGFEPSGGEVYGAALSRAYALESRVANYPRMVVGDELIRYLIGVRDQAQPDQFTTLSKSIAAACLKCLAYDDDGMPFVDYLGPYFRAEIGNAIGTGGVRFIDEAYNRVVEFSARYKAEKNSKLAFRYTLLRDYFESRLHLWADIQR